MEAICISGENGKPLQIVMIGLENRYNKWLYIRKSGDRIAMF